MSNATNTRDGDQHSGTKSPEQLEREVDQARARLSRTASELSDRLSPSELLDQALDMAREHGGEFGRNLGAQVKNNPMPMILTSVGLSWLMMTGKRNDTAPGYTSHGTHTGRDGSLMDSLGDVASKSRDKAAAAGDHLQGAGANMKESAQHARQRLIQFYRDQPLLAGSIGVAIGAALGALVPPTEDTVFGETSEHNVDSTKPRMMEEYDEVRDMSLTRDAPEANHRQ